MRTNLAKRQHRMNSRHGWVKIAAVVGIGIVSVVGGALAFSWISGNTGPTRSARLDMGMQLAQKGDYYGARQATAGIESANVQDDGELSKLRLISGIQDYELSRTATLKLAQFTYLDRAAKELEQSSKTGFPAGYEGLGNYYYGSTLYDLRRFKEAHPLLEAAVLRFPKKRFEAMEKLVTVETLHEKKKPQQIEKQVDRWINFPAANAVDIDRAHLSLAKMYEQAGQHDDVLKTLEGIAQDSSVRPEADLLAATVLIDKLPRVKQDDGSIRVDAKSRSELESIVKQLNGIVENVTANRLTRGRATYAMSVALHELDRSDEALTYLSNIRSNIPQTIESLAASVLAISIDADLKKWADAIQTLQILNNGFGEVRWYQNDWMPFQDVYDSLVQTGQKFLTRESGQFTIDFCEHLPKFISDEDRLRVLAPAYCKLAENQINRSDAQYKSPEKLVIRSELTVGEDAVNLFEQAGRSYERLANLQMITPDYSQFLLSAIRCYALGRDYVRSNILIERYLDVMPRSEQPTVLIQKAQNLFNDGDSAAALESLKRCIAIAPDHPMTATARLYAAQMLQNDHRHQEAADQLLSNLYDGSLTPASPIWKASLYDLGNALCRTGTENFATARSQYDLALPDQKKHLTNDMNIAYDELLKGIQRLEEAIRRYPNDDRNFDCLYQVAESYRAAAEWPKLKLSQVVSSTVDLRENYRNERDELLNQSRAAYVRLREVLTQGGESVAVDPIRRKLLENSFFGEADILYEMQDYEKAIGVYRSTSNRFLSQPASLEALTRVAQCLQQLGRHGEALRVVNQAIDLINRIDDSDPKLFEETTRGSKKEWVEYLNWLKTTLA